MADDEVGIRISVKQAVQAVAQLKTVKDAMAAVSKEAEKNKTTWSSLGSTSTGAISAMSRGVSSLVSNVANYSRYAAVAGAAGLGFGLKAASGLEQTNISMAKLLGSQPAATAMIKELQGFANTTPFDFTQTMDAAQSLLAQNFKPDELLRTLKVISDTTAATGKGAQGFNSLALVMGQMRNETKLNTRDLYQLTDAGVDGLGILSKAAGKTREEMFDLVGKGKVSGQQAGDALAKGLQQKFGGMSEAQGHTLGAQWSNFIGKIKAGLYTVDANGKVGGTLGSTVQLLERNLDSIQRKGGPVEKAMNGIGRGMQNVTHFISMMAFDYSHGGIHNMLDALGESLGLGNKLDTAYRYLAKDAKAVSTIWSDSWWPAIKNVAKDLAPLVGGALLALQGILQFMADHPDAASAVFYGLAAALAGGVVIAGLVNVTSKLIEIVKFAQEARAALIAVQTLSLAPAALGAVGAGAGAAGGLAAGAEGAAAGAGAGAIGAGIAATGAAGYFLYKGVQQLRSVPGKLMDQARLPHFATGGTKSVTGPAVINEHGGELVTLPGGAQVTNNADMHKMMAMAGGGGTTLNFHEGAFQGFDYSQTKKITDSIVQEFETRIARK
jgi:tape measure domain-containing protein